MRIDLLNLPKEYFGLVKRLGLEFKLGEILEAKVLKAESARALLLLKGQKILADVKTNLQPGDSIKVRVTGEFQNQVVLKVLANPAESSSPAEQLLRQAGFTPNDETRSALTFLLKNGLPVTPSSVQTVLTGQGKSLDQILTRLFFAQDAPVNTPSAKEDTALPTAAKGFVPGKAEILELLKQTVNRDNQSTQTPKSTEATPGGQTPAVEKAGAQQPKLAAPAGQNTIPAKDSSLPANQQAPGQQNRVPEPDISTGVKPTTTQQVTVLKAVVDQQTASTLRNTDGEKPVPANIKTTSAIPERLQAPIPNHQVEAEGKISQSPTQARVPVLQTLARLEQNGLALNPARSLPELVRGLKVLMQNFGLTRSAGPDAPAQESKPDLTSLLSTPLTETQTEAVKDLSEKMLAMRLHHKEPGVLLHMEIPLIFNQQLRTGVLQIRGDENHQTLAVEDRPLSILFRLETEDLGQLRVMVLLRDTEVNCQFAADREETRKLLRQSVPDLKSRFEALSYQVSHMGISTLSEEEVEKVEPLPGQVDFRV